MVNDVMTAAILAGAYLWAFWALYVFVMGVYRAHLSKRLVGLTKIMSLPIVVIGATVDVLANLTLATAIFLELPREALVTQRLQRHNKPNGSGWRYTLANWTCTHLLDPFDPTGDHC